MLEKELVLAGRNFLYFGCFAAFGFVGLVAMLFLFLKRSHKRLRKKFAETSDHEYDSKEVVLGIFPCHLERSVELQNGFRRCLIVKAHGRHKL
jgi:hypothetical protein